MSEELVWHEQQENILKKWGEIGSSYRFMHDRAFLYYEKQNFRFALPVIVISTITGTANFAQSSFPAAWQPYVPLFAGFLNLTAGLVTTIAQFLRVSELLEGHRSASIAYSKFSRNISVELSLPTDERSCGGREFIANSRIEIDRLIEQSPNIPLHIVKLFGKKFKDTTFIKPDILEITGVEVYKDDGKLQLLKEKQEFEKKEMELKILKEKKQYDEDLVKKIRDDEEKRSKEFENKLNERMLLEKKNIKNSVKLRAVEKKKKIGISSINKSMSSLIKKLEKADNNNAMVTPESSETDEESSNEPSPKSHVIDIPVTIVEENEVIISDNDPNEMKEVDFSNNSL
uniref:SMODS and SLOG-associating 2TM effector domain-containing protein n=1 Tax=viral metagenome TaxID=1070528 RepID=A0A6C0FCJ6_9ZZZZ